MKKLMRFESGGASISVIEILQILESRFSFIKSVEVFAGSPYVVIILVTLTDKNGIADTLRFELYFLKPTICVSLTTSLDETFEEYQAEILITLSVQFGGTFSISEKMDAVKTATTDIQAKKSNELINKLYDTSEDNKRQHKP